MLPAPWPDILGATAVVIGLGAQLYYLHGMFKGEFKPHAFTFLIYSVLTSIALTAQITGGAGSGWWVTAATVIFCATLFVYSLFKNKQDYIVRSDWFILLACLAAIPLWLLTKTPLYSVILICIIDASATWPALRKAWALPYEDSIAGWFVAGVKFLISLPAIEQFSMVTALYPAIIIIVNFIGAFCIYYRRKMMILSKQLT